MKRLLLSVPLIAGFLLLSCSQTGNIISTNAKKEGSASVTIAVGQVGAIAKMRAVASLSGISLSKLCISLAAPGEDTVKDTIALSGCSATTVVKTYTALASTALWTLTANTLDVNDSVIHWGSTTFHVPANATATVSLTIAAVYSYLKANFFPIRDSVTKCEVLVNSKIVADSGFAKQGSLGDTVQLVYNYLKAGLSQKISLRVRGIMWGIDTLLYSGDTVITPISGVNASYYVCLKWVGPNVPPPGEATINVVLGAIGTVTVNGQLPVTWQSLGMTMVGNVPFLVETDRIS